MYIHLFFNLSAPPSPLFKKYIDFPFFLDFFSDNVEINQGIRKSYGPLLFSLCDTLFEIRQCGSYIYCGVIIGEASQQSQVADMEPSLTIARFVWPFCRSKGITCEKIWYFGYIWHPFNSRIYQYNILMDTENITVS